MGDSDSSETSDLGDMDEAFLGNNTEPITIENVALLALECVGHFLQWHNLSWTPPIDPRERARQRVRTIFPPRLEKHCAHC
ncbi:hypothetical protein HNY73_007228 [Argiope bruennichi]|uniref:Uncharacterized protein n=1 Tax=Argiope bruennichi TaxID=94029 RepID=A0A8T0FFY6_ARGBR|nr:hypothetical protein HNY73_007228 [Argiope bruennichi]